MNFACFIAKLSCVYSFFKRKAGSNKLKGVLQNISFDVPNFKLDLLNIKTLSITSNLNLLSSKPGFRTSLLILPSYTLKLQT